VAPCSVVDEYRCFGGSCWLHLHGWSVWWFNPKDGGSIDVLKDGIQPPHYTAPQHRKPQIIPSSPWKPQTSCVSSSLIGSLLCFTTGIAIKLISNIVRSKCAIFEFTYQFRGLLVTWSKVKALRADRVGNLGTYCILIFRISFGTRKN
jgi:hypothetical protein